MKSTYEQLKYELSLVERNLDYTKEQLDYKNKQIAELQAKIESLYSEELEQCDFEIDFKAMNAFSIERNTNSKGRAYTIIGYLKEDSNEMGEWNFFCSLTQHQKLAEQFRKYMKK